MKEEDRACLVFISFILGLLPIVLGVPYKYSMYLAAPLYFKPNDLDFIFRNFNFLKYFFIL